MQTATQTAENPSKKAKFQPAHLPKSAHPESPRQRSARVWSIHLQPSTAPTAKCSWSPWIIPVDGACSSTGGFVSLATDSKLVLLQPEPESVSQDPSSPAPAPGQGMVIQHPPRAHTHSSLPSIKSTGSGHAMGKRGWKEALF